jgi:tannase/feruloyl esterase
MNTAARICSAAGLGIAIGVAGVRLAVVAEAASAVECTVAALQAKAPQATTITSASAVAATDKLTEYCRVDGNVATPGNKVNFRIGLPARWNGKYYFVGVGGLGGTIGSLDAGLARGYASASTDTGHDANDPAWESNMAAKIDYGHRGTHVTAVAGKALTKSYYSREPEHAYFNGCSNGGRQAMMEVQRYPEDFDGIIAGDPATGTPMQIGRALVFQQQLLHPERYVPIEKVELLSKATLAACDGADGLKDDLISDPLKCSFNPQTLKCAGADGPDCLTQAQIDSVNQIYSAVKTPDGKMYTAGFPVGHEGGATGWQAWTTGQTAPTRQPDGTLTFGETQPSGYRLSESNMRFLALERSDPSFNWKTVRFPQDLPRLKTMTEVLSPLDPDLRPFKARSGKLIVYHGWSDPAISAYGTIAYYDRMTKAVGGVKEAESFSRLYLVPGMHHCRGGPGPDSFDMLPVLEAWVEKGVAPAAVVASHAVNGKVDRTRPLCPYPQVAQYTGSGSIDDAANFRCVRAR